MAWMILRRLLKYMSARRSILETVDWRTPRTSASCSWVKGLDLRIPVKVKAAGWKYWSREA